MKSPPVADDKEDDAIEVPDSQVLPGVPPSASIDSDGHSLHDKSQASSYHSEDFNDETGGAWLSPKLKCWENKEAKAAKKKAQQEAAKNAKKEMMGKKKKVKSSPHPNELDQERCAERSVKHKKRTPDSEYDGLSTFQSPDRTGIKSSRSKDDKSATSTPDSKQDFHKA